MKNEKTIMDIIKETQSNISAKKYPKLQDIYHYDRLVKFQRLLGDEESTKEYEKVASRKRNDVYVKTLFEYSKWKEGYQ